MPCTGTATTGRIPSGPQRSPRSARADRSSVAGLAALAPGLLLLRGGAALAAVAALAAALAAALGRARGVGDLRRPLLRHALVLEGLVLLLVLHVRLLAARHGCLLSLVSAHAYPARVNSIGRHGPLG